MYDKMRSAPLVGPSTFAKAPSLAVAIIPSGGRPPAPEILPSGPMPKPKPKSKPKAKAATSAADGEKQEKAPTTEKAPKKQTIDMFFKALGKTLTDIEDLDALIVQVAAKGKD